MPVKTFDIIDPGGVWKRPPKPVVIHPCLVCGKKHWYVGHDGKPAPCGWCCTSHPRPALGGAPRF